MLTIPIALIALAALPQQPARAKAEPAVETVNLNGRVLDLRGEGVPVAEVWIRDPDDQKKKLRRTFTDADGYFVLSRVPKASLYLLYGTADGRHEDSGYTRSENSSATIELHDATTVRGVLFGKAGGVVSGVTVAAAPAGRALARKQVVATTDDKGRFVLERVPLGLSQITAWIPGEGLAELRHRVTGDDSLSLQVKDYPKTSIKITVQGLPEENPPVVRLGLRPYRSGSYVQFPPPYDDPKLDGAEWSAEGLPDWAYAYRPSAPGWAFEPDRIRMSKGPHTVKFTATRVRKAEGGESAIQCPAIVTDAQGKPVPEVSFVLRKSNGGERATATSDVNGALRFESPLAVGSKVIVYSTTDKWVIDQEKQRGMQGPHDRGFMEDHECKVDPSNTLRLTVVPAVEVSGRVLHGDGRPAALISITLEESRANRMPRWMKFAYETTDRDGNYRFRRLHHSGNDIRVSVAGASGSAMSDTLSIAEAGIRVRTTDLELAPPSTVGGVVRDKNGKPAPGITVWLRDWDMAQGRQRSGSVTEVITDRLGRYRFVGVDVGGAYLQLISDEDSHGHEIRKEPFEVEPGKTYSFDLVVKD